MRAPARGESRNSGNAVSGFSNEYWRAVVACQSESNREGITDRDIALLVDWVGLESPSRIIDVGCGDGALSAVLRGGWSGLYVGIDPGRGGLIQGGRRHLDGEVGFIQGDGTHLPLKTGCSPCVIAMQALHHAGWGLISEARRVLGENGILILVDHAVGDSLLAKMVYRLAPVVPLSLRRHPPLNAFYLDATLPGTLVYSHSELYERLQRSGFRVVEIHHSVTGFGMVLRGVLFLLSTRSALLRRALARTQARLTGLDAALLKHTGVAPVNYALLATTERT